MDERQPCTVEEICARANQERVWWEQVLAARGTDAMTQPGIVTPEWSFKDLVVHLNGWQRRALDQMAADRDRRKRPADPWPAGLNAIPDEDERVNQINAWIQEQGRHLSLAQVLADTRSQWDELLALISTTSVEDMSDPQLFAYLDGQSLGDAVMTGKLFSHVHDEHGADIERWLRGSEG